MASRNTERDVSLGSADHTDPSTTPVSSPRAEIPELLRRAVALKMALAFLLVDGLTALAPSSLPLESTIGASFLMALFIASPATVLGSACGLLGAAVATRASWPLTINHRLFELLLCLAAVILSILRRQRLTAPVWQSMFLAGMFTAGLQKIAHGQFLSGETLAVFWRTRAGPLGRSLDLLPSFGERTTVLVLTVISVGVVASEVMLSLTAQVRNTERSRTLVFMLGIGVALVAGEFDFAWLQAALLVGLTSSSRVRAIAICLFAFSALGAVLHR